MADVTALVAGDAVAFEALLQMLMSAANEQRTQAETVFGELKKHPDACVSHLLRSLRASADLQARALSGVLLRKVLTRDATSLWPSLAPATKALVKGEVLAAIREEQSRSILKKVCDVVAELGAGLVEEEEGGGPSGWPELLPFLLGCVQSADARLMEAALLIFEQFAFYVTGTLRKYLGTLHQTLTACLAHPATEVRLAAFKASVAFIMALDVPAERDQFQSMVPLMLGAVGAALNAGDELAAQEAVELLIDVAESHPRFLRRQLPDVAAAMLQIAETEALEGGTRQLAAEFLLTLCEAREKAPGMMRRLPNLAPRLFQCLLSFLLDVEDEAEWHAAVDERDEEAGAGELFEFGQQSLDRIAIAFGGKALVPVAGAALPALLADADWARRHAALVCLAQVAEGCAKVMAEEPVTGQLVAMCVAGAGDAHAKVRWAACQAAGQLCTDLGPGLQERHHATLLPALLALMDDFSAPRVQAHACAATVNFAETADQDLMAPYLPALCAKLLALLQRGARNVQEGALTALASVADSAQEYFVAFYDSTMPLLRHVLEAAQGREMRLLRAKALECVSLVGMAVGKERFAADAAAAMALMQAVSAAGLEADDPFGGYMLQAAARICSTLGQDFVPYLPIVMPKMLADATAQPEAVVRGGSDGDDASDEEGGGEEEEGMETFEMGGKRVSLHTSALEEKANACTMLCCVAHELRAGFWPYVDETTRALVPLVKFFFNEDVRAAAAQALPELLRAAVEAAAAPGGPDEAYLRQMAAFVWPALVDALKAEPEPDVQRVFLETFEELLDFGAGPRLLPAEQLGPAFEAFLGVLGEYEERRAERLERATGEDFDEDEREALEEEHEAETELLDALGDVATRTLKAYGDAAMPVIEALMPAAARLLGAGRFPEERRVALCLMDDVIQHSPAGAARYAPQALPLLLAGAADPDAGVRQSCLFGLGCCAARGGEAFRAHAPAAVAAIVAALRAPGARAEGAAAATDNAASALGKVLEHAPGAAGAAEGALYVAALPLEADESEAREAHAQLLRLLRASDARVLGEANAHLPKLVEALARILAQGTRLVAEADAAGMAALLQQMQAALPPGAFAAIVAALKPKQQATLQAVLEGRPAVPAA